MSPAEKPARPKDVLIEQQTEADLVAPWEPDARTVAQVSALMAQAQQGGLRFEAYLPPDLAVWLLGLIERGVFASPSEAVFVMLGEQRDMEPHGDLRQEVLRRSLLAAMDDPRPGIPAEEVFEKLRQRLSEPLPEPAKWQRKPHHD